MIEKNVFQTWKTQKLPLKIEKIWEKNRKINPGFNFYLYTDDQLYDFIKSNFDQEIFDGFIKLKHPVAKADFWRYLILYKYGGVYLDIDSKFNKPILSFINTDDEAVISAETNPGNYVQWALFYKKNHPILIRTIELILENLNSGLYKNDIERLTGPKVYARSIEEFYKISQNKNLNWSTINMKTNFIFNFNIDGSDHKVRLFGIDYLNNLQFKHKYSHILYEDSEHWLGSQAKEDVY